MSRTSNQQRGRIITELAKIGMSYEDSLRLLRIGATMQRLTEAECNGDWPADNGKREVKSCPKCKGEWVSESFRKGVCPRCRINQRAEEAARDLSLSVELNGDPRGGIFAVIASGMRRVWVA